MAGVRTMAIRPQWVAVMSTTQRARPRFAPWLLVTCFAGGLLVVGAGAVGVYSAWQAARKQEMDREFWAIEQKNIERKTSDELMKRLSTCRLDHFDELFPRRGLRHEAEMLAITKRSDDEVFKGEAAFIAKHRVSVDQFRAEFRRRHPDMESVLVEIPAAVRSIADRHFEQIRAEVADPEVQKTEQAGPAPWQEYSRRRAEACFADGVKSVQGLASYQRIFLDCSK